MELIEDTREVAPESFLALFDADPEVAAQHVEDLRAHVIRKLRGKGCREPEDVWAATVVVVLRKKLRPGDLQNPDGFIWGIAIRIWLNQRHRARAMIPLDDVPTARLAQEPAAPDRTFFRHLKACLEQLNRTQYEVLMAEAAGEDREELAARLGISAGTLRQRLFRARETLCRCLERRGITVSIEAGNV
jgi:DNA-directed RNA polymerase specialized sigma24 family protein